MEFEVPVKHPAALVWQTHVKNFQCSLPAVVPRHYGSVEYLEGPPLARGGVFTVNYDKGFGHYDYVKFVWDEIDHDNFYLKLTAMEGGALGKHFEDLVYYYKVLPGPDKSSCVMWWKIEHKDIGEHDFHGVLKDELCMFSENLEAHLTGLTTRNVQ